MSRLNRTIGIDPLPGLGFRSTLPKRLDVLPGLGATWRVQYAPGYEPLSVVPDDAWVDVTGATVMVRTMRGSTEPFGPIPPGQATIRLDAQEEPNTDLLHTSTNPSQAKVGHPVRVQADLPDGVVTMWTGYILSSEVQYDRPYRARVTWSCHDIIGWLARHELLEHSAPANTINSTIAGALNAAGLPTTRIDLDVVERRHLAIIVFTGRTMTLVDSLTATAGPNAYVAATTDGKVRLHANDDLAGNTISNIIIGPPETGDTLPQIEWASIQAGVASKDLANIVQVQSTVIATIRNEELVEGGTESVTYQAATETVSDEDSIDTHGPARRNYQARYRPQDGDLMREDARTILRGFKDATPVVRRVKVRPTELGSEIEALVRLDLGSRVTVRAGVEGWQQNDLDHTADYHIRSIQWSAAMTGRGATLECSLGLIPVFRA